MSMEIDGTAGVKFPDGTQQTTAYKAGFALFQDQKAVGTSGGASVVGSQTRALGTAVANSITGASLAANQITLPAGRFRFRAEVPAYLVLLHKAYLYNVTTGALAIPGTSAAANSAQALLTHSMIRGVLTLATPTVFEIRHYTDTVNANGLGAATNSAAAGVEVYSTLEIIQEA